MDTQQFSVSRHEAGVLLVCSGKGAWIHYSEVLGKVQELRNLIANIQNKNYDKAKDVVLYATEAGQVFRFSKNDLDEMPVSIIYNGKLLAHMPIEVVSLIIRQVNSVAKEIENEEDKPRLITDQAMLFRAGINVGFTNNPKILAEAHKEAQWNTTLRRHQPAAVKPITSTEWLGTPSISVGPAK